MQAVLPGATRTEIWSTMGIDADQLPQGTVMDAAAMVDAALTGFDRGELVTIPSLPDAGAFEAYTEARLAMAPNLSRSEPAARLSCGGSARMSNALVADDVVAPPKAAGETALAPARADFCRRDRGAGGGGLLRG